MKIKLIILNLILLINIASCNGQDKKHTSVIEKTKSTKISITDNFDKVDKVYFAPNDKSIYSTSLIKNLGKYTIYYIPKSSKDNDYYQNIEKNNNIKPLYDELNSSTYYSQDDNRKIDKILKEKIKNEADFQIIGTFIDKKYINIENENDYSINFPFVQKYYKKENKKWIFLFDKNITNADDEIKYNNRSFINSQILDKDKKTENQYSINGQWLVDCEKGVGSLLVNNNDVSLTVLYNQIYIDMVELKRYDDENGIAYKLKEIPEDIGNIGRNLNWKEYLNNEPIAYVKMIDNKTMHFYWYGFYNSKTKKREFKEINFNQETANKDIILKKCTQ